MSQAPVSIAGAHPRATTAPSTGILVFLKPRHSGVGIVCPKVAHLGTHEVIRKPPGDRQEGAIRDNCDLGDVAMMVAHETKMGQKGAKVLPAGERRCLDKQSPQIPSLGDVRVDLRSEPLEVAGRQWALGLDDKNAVELQKIMSQHRRPPEDMPLQPEDRSVRTKYRQAKRVFTLPSTVMRGRAQQRFHPVGSHSRNDQRVAIALRRGSGRARRRGAGSPIEPPGPPRSIETPHLPVALSKGTLGPKGECDYRD